MSVKGQEDQGLSPSLGQPEEKEPAKEDEKEQPVRRKTRNVLEASRRRQ